MFAKTGNEHIKDSLIKRGIASLVAMALAFSLWGISSAQTQDAYAATEETEAELTETQAHIEETAAAYDAAVTKVEDLEAKIAENEEKFNALENELPDQQEKSAEAAVSLYKMQHESYGLINLVLDSESFNEVLTIIDYLNNLQESNLDEITRLSTLKAELEETQSELEDGRLEAETEKANAESALESAQLAREEAQAKAEAEAAAQAAAEAEALAAAQAEAAAQAAAESQQANTPVTSETPGAPTTSSPIDWSVDKQAFVDEWGVRIDRYLAGSPTAGCGRIYAEAAWNYGIDPRYSPAISYLESSKGAACFQPYNAWGWMSGIRYTSWEESINAHVRGLSRGYSYTVSVSDAKKYCPPNWEHWYNTVSAQINLI